jgi:DNA replication protein DnaC
MTLTRSEIFTNLTGRIDDQTYDRIEADYPLSTVCPTCGDRGKYTIDFEVFDCDCDLQKLLQKHYFAANIGREYHDICLKDFQGEDTKRVVPLSNAYLEKFDDNFHYGIGITFSGPVGTGKTFAMTSILKELIKRSRKVYFITFEELIDVWGSSWHDETAKKRLQDKLKRAEVLGIDEVRTDPRNNSGFLANGFDSVIRHRTSNLLPTLITTNMEREDELKEFFKVYSLLAARNERVNTLGHDRRMKEIRNRTFELRERGERRAIC